MKGNKTCRVHGGHRKVCKGEASHFFKNKNDSRLARRQKARDCKTIKAADKLLSDDAPITHLPFDDAEARKLNREADGIIAKILAREALKEAALNPKPVTHKKPKPVPQKWPE
jgi:hypothetical protein